MYRDGLAARRLLGVMTAGSILLAACSGGAAPAKPEAAKTEAKPTAAVSQPKVEFQPKAEAAKTEPQSKADASPETAPPPAANPKTNRLVMGIVPPSLETNAIRDLTPTIIWQLKPMYEYLLMVDGATGKLVPLHAERSRRDRPGLHRRSQARWPERSALRPASCDGCRRRGRGLRRLSRNASCGAR